MLSRVDGYADNRRKASSKLVASKFEIPIRSDKSRCFGNAVLIWFKSYFLICGVVLC